MDLSTSVLYTLSLHDALPIYWVRRRSSADSHRAPAHRRRGSSPSRRSEEHTSELQSLRHLVCRLLLEKKKKESMLQVKTEISVLIFFLELIRLCMLSNFI